MHEVPESAVITEEIAKDRPDLIQIIGEELTVIAWLWTRTVRSPNPAFANVAVPLASTFVLSAKEGKEAYVQPIKEDGNYRFMVRVGKPPAEAKDGTSAGKRAAFRCLMSNVPMDYDYIRREGKSGRLGQKLMAIVAEGVRGRVYLSSTDEMERLAASANPTWKPDLKMPDNPRDFKTPNYGLTNFADLFTSRQMLALTTFSDLVSEARERIRQDAIHIGLPDDDRHLDKSGVGARAYAEAVSVYLAFAVDKASEGNSVICTWSPLPTKLHVVGTFGRQALPMTWDYAESNPFANSSGNIDRMSKLAANSVENCTFREMVTVMRPG